MKSIANPLALALLGLGLVAGPVDAALVTFVGSDIGAGPGSPRPNSDPAAASFDAAAAAIGTVSRIDFESSPLGSFSNLSVAPGVTINGADLNGASQTIRNTTGFPTAPALDGSNTTAGGSRFVELLGGNLVFTFAQPTQFFGVYLTGIQTAFFSDNVTFNDGTSQMILAPAPGTSSSVGAIVFVGFTDANKFITSITINAGIPSSTTSGQDAIGVDDVRFQGAAVPEPAAILNCLAGGSICLGYRSLRRRASR